MKLTAAAILLLSTPALAGGRLYVNSFQDGKILAYDIDKGTEVGSLPVEDGAGSAYALPERDGKKLYVIDGDKTHRLRVVEAAGLKVTAEVPFTNRRLNLGEGPEPHLTADGKALLVPTYDYAAASEGIRVFLAGSGAFAPIGLRAHLCSAPHFASAADGTLLQSCPGEVATYKPDKGIPAEFSGGPKLRAPGELADAHLTPDGHDAILMERAVAGKPWRIWRWTIGESSAHVQSLRALPGAGQGGIPSEGAELALGTAGHSVAVALGSHVWILDVLNLKIQHSHKAPSGVRRLAFTPDGKELLALVDGPAVVAYKTSGKGERTFPLKNLKEQGPIVTFLTAPAP